MICWAGIYVAIGGMIGLDFLAWAVRRRDPDATPAFCAQALLFSAAFWPGMEVVAWTRVLRDYLRGDT